MVPNVMQVHGHERKSQAAINKSTAKEVAEISSSQGCCGMPPPSALWVGAGVHARSCQPRWPTVHSSP
jgi:hypothetical protein